MVHDLILKFFLLAQITIKELITKIKKIPLGKKWKCSYKMKNKTFKANINIPCHLRFKSRYFQNFEYQENFVRTSEEYMWYDHRVTALPHR